MRLRRFLRGRQRNQRGYVAVLTAMLFASIFLVLSAIAVDIARVYLEANRVQKAADAAALAGVTYMPQNLSGAQTRAISVAGTNGYPNSGTSTVTAVQGTRSTQLTVTVTSKIHNVFGGLFGVSDATVVRSATADYHGPVPLGSPCNNFGNEPSGAGSDDVRGPSTTQIVTPPGGATCSANPQFWTAIAGPDTAKHSGDAYMTRTCSSPDSGCSGTTNTDFRPNGYFYIVRVGAAAVGTALNLQIFDPAFVESGDTCANGPTASSGNAFKNNENPFVTSDGITRYAAGTPTTPSPNFCTGDVLTSTSSVPPTTSYVLRSPVDSHQPLQAAPIAACEHQYQGYDKSNATSNVLDSTNAAYKADVAKVYRQWVRLCQFTPTKAGDYYLQIRTNVALGGSSDGEGGYTSNSNVWTQTSDDTAVKGDGNNRFAMRVTGAQRGATSISGNESMELFANYSGAVQQFNLVQVIPSSSQLYLDIGFYDVGDATNPGTIKILPPSDSNLPASMSGCTGNGPFTGAMTDCTLTNVSNSTYNGKWQYVRVPIPSTYTCNSTQTGGCWFQVQFSFPGSVPTDTTTWTASIDGDPVTLVQ